MNRIRQVFENKKAFIPFIAAGDPDLSIMEALAPAVAEADTDLIGLGIPFSDPVAEGIVIQEADLRSPVSGTTTDKISNAARRIRQKTDVSLVFMTYINPVLTYGVGKFVENAADCGIDALIVPDMPFEEREELLPAYKEYGMTLIYLVAPTSRERAQAIARESDGFVYCVSSLGVASVRSEITTNVREMVDIVKQNRNVPCTIGFDISTPEQASKMASQANGVIMGSVIVKMTARYGVNCVEPICGYVKQMKAAVEVQTMRTG